MEYRRRRKRRHRKNYMYAAGSSYGKQQESGGFLSALLIIILTGGLIYMLFATPVGTWLAKNVFPPAFIKKTVETPTPSPSRFPAETPSNAKNKTEEIKFSAFELYLLQMGIYSSSEYSSGLVSSLKSLGAAGYEYKDKDGYIHIFAAAYSTEAAAQSVCERLISQGYECKTEKLSGEGVSLSVTTDETYMEAIKYAIGYSAAVIHDLSKEVIAFDSEERSVDYGRAIINEMLANVKNIRSELGDISEKRGVVKNIDNYYMKLTGMLSSFIASDTDNRVEMSGKLKHIQIDAFLHYLDLLNSIRNL